MGTTFKAFNEFVIILFLFYFICFGFWPHGIWDFSSWARDGTHTPCIRRGSLNPWTTRGEVPPPGFIALGAFKYNMRASPHRSSCFLERLTLCPWPVWPLHVLNLLTSGLNHLNDFSSPQVLNSVIFQPPKGIISILTPTLILEHLIFLLFHSYPEAAHLWPLSYFPNELIPCFFRSSSEAKDKLQSSEEATCKYCRKLSLKLIILHVYTCSHLMPDMVLACLHTGPHRIHQPCTEGAVIPTLQIRQQSFREVK